MIILSQYVIFIIIKTIINLILMEETNKYILQLFRNKTVGTDRATTIEKLANKLNGAPAGEPILGTYKEGNDKPEKIILGIKGIEGYQLFEGASYEGGKLQIPDNVKEVIDALRGEVVTSITKDGDVFTVVDGDMTQDDDTSTEGKQLKLNYASKLNNLKVPNAVGGIKADTSVEDLKTKTYGEILDMILFPELNPTVTVPSASIALKAPFANNGVYEVGATAPVVADFTTGFSRGKGQVGGQSDKFRAGELIAANSFIYYGGNTATTTLPAKVALGEMRYNYQAAYGQGETLVTSYGKTATKDSAGKALTNPLAAGSVNSGAVQIYGTYPYFCNGATASSSTQDTNLPTAVTANTKLPLQKWTDTLVGAKFASEAATSVKFIFDFPSAKKITKVEFMNTVSGKWENFADYSVADTDAKTVQGASVNYKRLTTTGPLKGALQLRFTVANA